MKRRNSMFEALTPQRFSNSVFSRRGKSHSAAVAEDGADGGAGGESGMAATPEEDQFLEQGDITVPNIHPSNLEFGWCDYLPRANIQSCNFAPLSQH